MSGDIEGGDSQEKPETGEGAEVMNLKRLEIPSVGLVIEKGFLNSLQEVKALAEQWLMAA